MVNREEPRITQVEQGVDLSDRNQPVYNLLDHNLTVGISASKWRYVLKEDGDWTYNQEYLDISEFAIASSYKFEQDGEEGLEQYFPFEKCDFVDPHLEEMLAKAICLPKTQELKLYGDYSLKYGMGSGLNLDPKCLGTTGYNENFCSEEETERFLELLGDDEGV